MFQMGGRAYAEATGSCPVTPAKILDSSYSVFVAHFIAVFQWLQRFHTTYWVGYNYVLGRVLLRLGSVNATFGVGY